MKRLAILVALCWASVAHATTPIISTGVLIGSTGSTAVSNSADTYFAITGIQGTDASNSGPGSTIVTLTESSVVSHTFRNFFCFLGTAPGVGKSYTIGIVASAATFANSITISGTNTSGSDTVNTQSDAAFGNSNIAFKVTPASTPAASTVSCYVEVTVN